MQLLALSLFHVFLAKKKTQQKKPKKISESGERHERKYYLYMKVLLYMKMFGGDMALTEWCFLGGEKLPFM